MFAFVARFLLWSDRGWGFQSLFELNCISIHPHPIIISAHFTALKSLNLPKILFTGWLHHVREMKCFSLKMKPRWFSRVELMLDVKFKIQISPNLEEIIIGLIYIFTMRLQIWIIFRLQRVGNEIFQTSINHQPY